MNQNSITDIKIELKSWKRQRNSLVKENVKLRKALELCDKAFYLWDGSRHVSSGHWSQLYDARQAVKSALSNAK